MLADWETYTIVASFIGGGGVAWGGVTAGLRGVKKEQSDFKEALRIHTAEDRTVQVDMVDRLARIETKLDDLRTK